jgi:hypothetical protein
MRQLPVLLAAGILLDAPDSRKVILLSNISQIATVQVLTTIQQQRLPAPFTVHANAKAGLPGQDSQIRTAITGLSGQDC